MRERERGREGGGGGDRERERKKERERGLHSYLDYTDHWLSSEVRVIP